MEKIKNNMSDPVVGHRVGIYDVMYLCEYKHKDGHKMYHIKCSKCGKEFEMKLRDIRRAKTCTHIGSSGKYIRYDTQWKNPRIGSIFKGMRERCYNSNDKFYHRYGGRGIKICDEWLENPMSFEKWSMENGYTDELTIDRINVDGNYCPENCRWVTGIFNAKYKSTTRLINVDGEIHTGSDWARILGLGPSIINKYVRKYGLNSTTEFIRRFKRDNTKTRTTMNQSYYDLYMRNGYYNIYI